MDPLGLLANDEEKKCNACVSLMVNFTLLWSYHQSRFHRCPLPAWPWKRTLWAVQPEFPPAIRGHLCRHNLGQTKMLEFIYSRDCCTRRWRHLKKFGRCYQTVMSTCQRSTLFCTTGTQIYQCLKLNMYMYICTQIYIHIQKYMVLSRLGMEKLLHGEHPAFKMCTPSMTNHHSFSIWINHMEWWCQACTTTVHLLQLL